MTDWPSIIDSILGPVSIIVLAYFTFLINRQVKATHEKVIQVDHAVNGKAPGEPSMSQDVETIKHKQERDVPTTDLSDGGNGASLRLQMRYLTTLVENFSQPAKSQQKPKPKPMARKKR